MYSSLAIRVAMFAMLMIAPSGGRPIWGGEPAHAAEVAGSSVVIPNFFDPNRRLDRPAVDAVGSIRFATSADFPPFSFIGPDGALTGFNVDLARAICTELAISCTMQARPFDSLAASIGEGRIDAAIAGLAITAEARKALSFSEVYLRPAARFLGPASRPDADVTPAALAGRTVAVVAGSAHEAYVTAFFPKAKRLTVETLPLATEAMTSGKADLVFGDGLALAFFLQSAAAKDCCRFVGGPYLEPHFFGEGFAIALPPEKPELRHAIDWALDSLYDKGVFAELYLRYFPVGYF
ncbi:amino acid ABC transporter substrate-binding protein, PAAT family [Kaistia soli DSM 19436]|uniref:Amino acid ABC transporter substrate-binding protein, PAAT family n=1 Tax=Kaistia soli DSM 19436 TaxID=1122133 RepID=A0A1M4YS49_9HYPH|nr:transporter substrate-binding domain-containing protein [Kaistia soli]SHF08541.1 amino acid ABC transporter substrate-binding protein, PAAT family [Kaistia soli DSM 19436]